VKGTYFGGSFWNLNGGVSNSIVITVEPRTETEMDAYIQDLTNRLEMKLAASSTTNSNLSSQDLTVRELIMKLMCTCSEKVAPTLLKDFYAPNNDSFWVNEALLYYVPRSPQTKKAVLDCALDRGLGENGNLSSLIQRYGFTKEELKPIIERALAPDNESSWSSGASLASQYGDVAFVPRLCAIAKNPKSNGQNAAINALANCRTDEGVATLKQLLDDPHQKIWTTLAFALLNAFETRQNSTEESLRPDDFTASDIKPLIGRMLSEGRGGDVSAGLRLIQQFGSEDFNDQVLAMATNSTETFRQSAIYALASNRSEAGVAALKTLLDDPDLTIRQCAETAIRNAYTSRGTLRGKPLKPDDFDVKYQQPEPVKTKGSAPAN
jgi:hypothetical protein